MSETQRSNAGAPSALGSLRELISWLSPRRRRQLVILLGGSLVGAIAEFAIFGALVPFMTVLADPAGAGAGAGPGAGAGAEDGTLTQSLAPVLDALARFTGSDSPIVPLGAALVALVLVATVVRLVLIWATTRFAHALGHELSVRLYRTTLHRPYTFHVSKNTSDIIAGVEKANQIVISMLLPVLDVVVAVLLAIGIIGALLWVDWQVATLAALFFGGLYVSISRISRSRLLQNSRQISASVTQRVRSLQEGLGGIRDTILDGSQPIHASRFSGHDVSYRAPLVRNQLWAQVPRYLLEGLGIGVIIGLTLFISSRSGSVSAALPVLGAVALGAQRLLPLFQRIYAGWTNVMGSRGYVEDVLELLEDEDTLTRIRHADAARVSFKHELRLEGLGFRYGAEAPWVFRGFDLTIPKGSRVGFAGQTGCGKSTLLDVVMGLLLPVEGHVSVDGTPITADNVQAWRAHIAHVPQAIFLADSTIGENIAFGIPPHEIDPARVKEAAERARIHDFIAGLPNGYDTMVGERGVRLSGGQRQRVGIARALYRKADVLVLDEATSALDNETEASVMEGIDDIGPDVTVLIVAHRLSTLDNCDQVIRMDQRGVAAAQVASSAS